MSRVRRPSLFSSSTGLQRRSSGSANTTGGELDLRAEFDLIVYGDDTHIPHGRLVLVRHMRRDSDGNPSYCTCKTAGDALDPDPDCSYCLGEGYLWDEQWHMCFAQYAGPEGGMTRRGVWVSPGEIRVDYRLFFFRYDSGIQYQDKIVEVKLDEEGDPILPYVRETIYKPQTVDQKRSDHGRIEYIAVYCKEEDAIRSDTPE